MFELFEMWALVEIIGLIFLPLTTTVFRHMPDRGWAWSKALGLAIVAICIWLPLMVLHFLTFDRLFILGVLLLLFALNLIALTRTYGTIVQILKSNVLYVVTTECIFLVMVGILGYTEEPLVSSDFRGDTRSSIFSGLDTLVVGNLVKVVSWYDNEYGYACRLSDITAFVARHLGGKASANGSILKEIVGEPAMWGKNPRLTTAKP